MRHLLPLCTLLACAAACGGGGSTDAGKGGESLGLLMTDAPADGLSVFSLDVTSVVLLRADGTGTANLLAAPRNFNVLGLAGLQALLGLADPPAGTYTGIRLAVDPASVRAFDKTGAAVAVRVTRAVDDASFLALDASNLVLDGVFRRVLLDVDLAKSLTDDSSNPGGLAFELELEAEHEFEHSAFDEFRGRVISEDPSASRFVADLLDDSGAAAFGRVTVVLSPGDALIGDDQQAFGSEAAFFAALAPGAEVEVHGAFAASGAVNATRVEIEDGQGFPVKIKGEVLSVDAGLQEFELLWREVRRGSSLAYPVLAQVGNPRVLTIAWDAGTTFRLEDGGAATAAGLVPGTDLYVSFADFAAPMPFLAAQLELDDEGAAFEGSITDVSGLDSSCVMQLDADEPAWLSGSISAPATIVLAGVQRIWLDTAADPVLQAGELLTGLKIEVHGALSGPPAAAVIAASQLKVKPGRLEGVITGVNPGAETVQVSVQSVKDPFGGAPPAGSILVQVPADARITLDGTRTSLSGLAAAQAGLGAGQSLSLKLEGLADGAGGWNGWQLEAKVKN